VQRSAPLALFTFFRLSAARQLGQFGHLQTLLPSRQRLAGAELCQPEARLKRESYCATKTTPKQSPPAKTLSGWPSDELGHTRSSAE